MTIGERIREIRKVLDINQTAFGSRIGLKQAAIGLYENEQRTVSDRCISDICREFNVNEKWLRNETGEMFIEPATFSLDEYAHSHDLKEMDINLIRGFMELDPNVRSALYDMFKKAFVNEPSNGVKSLYEESPKTPEELERLYPPVNFNKNTDVS